jgi:hypothetical protein
MYWRKAYIETLKTVAAGAGTRAEWTEYATFCLSYENGLREHAFVILEHVISKLERAPFHDRRKFVSWVMHATEGKPGHHMAVPNPLQLRIVEPTLAEWTILETNCAEPHRWLGGHEHLTHALKIDPNDQYPLQKLIVLLLSSIGTAELPERYLGSPTDDLDVVKEAAELLDRLSDENARQLFSKAIREERTLILDHLRGS